MGNLCVTGASSRSKKEESQKTAVEAPPSPVEQTTFKWTIDGFSSLLDFDEGWTASRVFEISGVKWYLMVNPRDTKSGDQNEYVSLLLQLSGASMRSDTIVEATFKFFIYDQLYGKHHEQHQVSHSFQTASPRSGTSCMIPLATLKEESSGFLYGNSCVFGVEFIKVIAGKSNDATDKLFVKKEINKISSSPKVFSWNIEDFFLLKSPSHSPEFELCGNKCNNFSGELTKVNFVNLPDLQKIDLLFNNFTGTVPESTYSCSKLIALRLSYNSFHGPLSEKIGNLKSLSFLSLANNSLTNITRTLQILSNSRSLTTLYIGFNFLHEAMPEDVSIEGFENLQVLYINHCSLSGKIPDWLSKLPNLGMLFLEGNQLTGPIPEWISSLHFLFCLDISNNSLTGEIPGALMEIPMLESDNTAPKVFFELPVWNKNQFLQYLTPSAFPKSLNLAMNNFTGMIPEKIGQLRGLVSLNLSSTRLSGEIPEHICNLMNLQMLDLSGNHLTGTIPAALKNLHFLSRFNISNNDLEGSIPSVGQFSTFPDSSLAGNPKLCGRMVANRCGSAEASSVSVEPIKQSGSEVIIFMTAFGVFFGVGVLYDQKVLATYFG